MRVSIIIRAATLIVVAGLPIAARAQSPSELIIGQPSPEIELKKLLQAPTGARFDKDSLKGQVTVLEFWATWCAPCISAFPHINEMSDYFLGKPVRFISVTDEDPSVVEAFLKRRILKGWIGLDKDRSTTTSFAARALPKTIIIDTEGNIALITQPKQLTRKILEDLVEKRYIAAAEPLKVAAPTLVEKPKPPEELKPIYAVSIKPSKSDGYSWSLRNESFRGRLTLKTLLRLVHDISETRILGPNSLNDGTYEITATLAGGTRDDVKQILATAVEFNFNLKLKREARELDVYVLTAPKPNEVKLRSSSSSVGQSSDDEGVLAAHGVPITALVDGLEKVLKKPVIDNTGLKGMYAWDVLFDPKEPTSIRDALRNDLGLILSPKRQQIDVLVVEVSERRR